VFARALTRELVASLASPLGFVMQTHAQSREAANLLMLEGKSNLLKRWQAGGYSWESTALCIGRSTG